MTGTFACPATLAIRICGDRYHSLVSSTYYHRPSFLGKKIVNFRFVQIFTNCFSYHNNETGTQNQFIPGQKANRFTSLYDQHASVSLIESKAFEFKSPYHDSCMC